MSQTTYRFKFNKEMLNNIREFSKLHSNDSCDEFAEAFYEWVNTNKALIDSETNRMENLGFKGNIEKKIYKSARYYFKNKTKKRNQIIIPTKTNTSTIPYIPRNPPFFNLMETYIKGNPIKASVLYKQFINETDETIQSEIQKEVYRLSNFNLSHEQCMKKLHKTFDNAYYKLKKKNNKNSTIIKTAL